MLSKIANLFAKTQPQEPSALE